jgi:hypothetical protein
MDTAQLLQRCKTIGTGTWSDALDACSISGVVRGLVQRSGRGRFAGFAVTARERAGALGSFPRTDFGVGNMIAAIAPGDVLMADVGGADISTFGGLAAFATKQRGAAAVVIDGGCRDVEEIRATDLRLASRSVNADHGQNPAQARSYWRAGPDRRHCGEAWRSRRRRRHWNGRRSPWRSRTRSRGGRSHARHRCRGREGDPRRTIVFGSCRLSELHLTDHASGTPMRALRSLLSCRILRSTRRCTSADPR